MIAGSAVVATGAFIPTAQTRWERGLSESFTLMSPLARTSDAVAGGRTLYRERCLACHGERGRGDGPVGTPLVPRPADLVLHVPQHTDGELFYYVSAGIPGTAMPAWRDALGERERWQIVHYLRVLADGTP